MKKRVIQGGAPKNLKFWANQQERKKHFAILVNFFGGEVFQPLRGGEVPPVLPKSQPFLFIPYSMGNLADNQGARKIFELC